MGNMIIGICDDELSAILQLEKAVTGYFDKNPYIAEIIKFSSGEDLLSNEEKLDILFLDIEMPGMDGIEAGKRIHKKNAECKIIMATSRIERFKEAFKIAAFRFVSKPFETAEIEAAIEDTMMSMLGMETVKLYENRISYMICQKDIEYISAYDGYVEALVGRRKMRKDTSLAAMERVIDNQLFYRVNRTYLVNLFHCQYNRGVISVGGCRIKVPRVKKKEFEHIFREFDLKYR